MIEATWVAYVIGLAVSMAAWFVFLWAIRDGQFQEPEQTAQRMLETDDEE
jgi:cbb3-type cytochrome oxidase maturation protein